MNNITAPAEEFKEIWTVQGRCFQFKGNLKYYNMRSILTNKTKSVLIEAHRIDYVTCNRHAYFLGLHRECLHYVFSYKGTRQVSMPGNYQGLYLQLKNFDITSNVTMSEKQVASLGYKVK